MVVNSIKPFAIVDKLKMHHSWLEEIVMFKDQQESVQQYAKLVY